MDVRANAIIKRTNDVSLNRPAGIDMAVAISEPRSYTHEPLASIDMGCEFLAVVKKLDMPMEKLAVTVQNRGNSCSRL